MPMMVVSWKKSVAAAVAVAAVAMGSAPTPSEAFTPGAAQGLVTMFQGPGAAAGPNPTQQAMFQVGQEMVQDYVQTNGNPYLQMIENSVVPVVDGYLHAALDPYAPVVGQIVKNENATREYIETVDEALVDAIEESMLNPGSAQETVRAFSQAVLQPITDVAEQGVAQVRERVVETADERLRRTMAPFMPFAHLMGKDGDIDAWINAIDESLGNVIEFQPLSEEAQALKELREVLMEPYNRAKLSSMGAIDADIANLEGGAAAPGASAAAVANENPVQRWYRRFWEVRNGLTGSTSIGDVLAQEAAKTQAQGPVPAGATANYQLAPQQQQQQQQLPPAEPSIFSSPGVTKEHFQAHDNKMTKQRIMANIRMRLKSLLGSADLIEELIKMNPRFLLKHPNWAATTAAKLKEDNLSITNKEIADTLTDMLRMKRMKQQARILANMGCNTKAIETKLHEYWVENKVFAMKDVKC